jgi:hypothetical protein
MRGVFNHEFEDKIDEAPTLKGEERKGKYKKNKLN